MSFVLPKTTSMRIPDILQEKGWQIIYIDDRSYLAKEGEEFRHAIDGIGWDKSKAGFCYPQPTFVRFPVKKFNPKVWCEKCELPEEDCCCEGGAIINMELDEETNKLASQGYLLSVEEYEDKDAEYISTPMSKYKVAGVTLNKTVEYRFDEESGITAKITNDKLDVKKSWWQKLFSK